MSAAVHFEMTPDHNWIDNNIIWDVRNAEPGTPGQRGCAGSGIFDNASSNLTVAQNLIGRCDNAGIFAIVRADRGRPMANKIDVANNVFVRCKAATVFLDSDNRSDENVYVEMPPTCLGITDGIAASYGAEGCKHITYLDLAAWRAAHGWDRRSVMSDARIDFDPITLTLTMIGSTPLPRVAAISGIEADMLGAPTVAIRIAAPVEGLRANHLLNVDPRQVAETDKHDGARRMEGARKRVG